MKDIVIINNYVNIPIDSQLNRHLSEDVIMFLGKMDYEPNITAVSHFVNNIFPKLKEKKSSLEFIIVGAKPTKKISDFGKIEGITVTGFVESTESYFQNATIVIAPMLSGAGVQNKIIQAMSYGCCVATTSIGAEGLDLRGGELAIFNTDDEWISGILELLSNHDKRFEMGEKAHMTIKNTLSKEIVYCQFKELIKRV